MEPHDGFIDVTEKRFRAYQGSRDSKRFAIEQEAVYKILDLARLAAPESGTGITVDISSGGVPVNTKQSLPHGKHIEISVNWPALLMVAALKLVAVGRMVRADEHRAAMLIGGARVPHAPQQRIACC